jgi:hypothetical protein
MESFFGAGTVSVSLSSLGAALVIIEVFQTFGTKETSILFPVSMCCFMISAIVIDVKILVAVWAIFFLIAIRLWWRGGGGKRMKKKAKELGDKSRQIIAGMVREIRRRSRPRLRPVPGPA